MWPWNGSSFSGCNALSEVMAPKAAGSAAMTKTERLPGMTQQTYKRFFLPALLLLLAMSSIPTSATSIPHSAAPLPEGTEGLPPGASVQTVLENMDQPVAMAAHGGAKSVDVLARDDYHWRQRD